MNDRLYLLFACISLVACATTSNCPTVSRSESSEQRVQHVVSHEEHQPRCAITRPTMTAGQHLTAISLASDDAATYMLGVGASRGIAPQADHYCYQCFADREEHTIYFVTMEATAAVLIQRQYEQNDGTTVVRNDSVVLPRAIELDGQRVATNVACRSFLGMVACEHDLLHTNE